MSTAALIYETTATTSTNHAASTTTTISLIQHQHSRTLFPPSTIVMQTTKDNTAVSAWCSPPRPTSVSGAMRASSIHSSDTDEENEEPFQASFIMTSSPMPSLRRVDEEMDVAPLSVNRFRILDRTTSAPITCSERRTSSEKPDSAKQERRSIFNAFWQSSSMRSKERFQMPPRPTSSGMLEASFPRHPSSLPHKAMSLRSRDEYNAAVDALLPCVPAPLERLLSRSSGMYPLFEPKSILKKEGVEDDDDSISQSVAGLKQTLQRLPSEVKSSEDSATETTCASSTAGKAVHFDPRVVVTEIHDECPRSWYSDCDLRRFQQDTCNLAKAYLQMHPELIPLYSKPVYDPILKKSRRKPLFGLQGLCDLDVCLNDLRVKRILVVDPNEKILNLLCRSLQMIFPAAEMIRATNGPAALEVLKTYNVDIGICQEHLVPHSTSCMQSSHGDLDTSAALFARYQQEATNKWRNSLLISITPEMEAVGERSIVGHGPTDFVWGMPPPKMNLGLQKTLVDALETKKKQHCECKQ